MYQVFLAIHVLCAGLWVANLPVILILNKLRKRAENTSGEVHYMAAAGRIGLVMGNIGAIGILISGPALEGMSPYYNWFQFGEQTWLAIKQVNFILAILVTGAMLVPRSKRLRLQLQSHFDPKRGNTGASDDLRTAFGNYVTAALILNTIVLINILLGEIRF